MKKRLLIFSVVLLAFGLAIGVQAFPIDPTGATPIYSPPRVPLPYIDGSLWTNWSTGYVGGTADLYEDGYTNPQQPGQDKLDNLNRLISLYNTANSAFLPVIGAGISDIVGTGKNGTLNVSDWEYVSLKFGNVFGLWDVRSVDSFNYSGLKWGLSHHGTWNRSIPEPANMLLLGIGLIGFAVIGRKNIFKK